jgi:hypothetical protein
MCAQLPPNTLAVDPSLLLKDGSIQLRTGNCVVPAPSAEWQWRKVDLDTESYVCVNPKTRDLFSVTVHDYPATRVGKGFRSDILEGFRKTAVSRGYTVEVLSQEPPPLPGAMSAAFGVEMRLKGGEPVYMFGYAIPTGRVCVVQAYSTDPNIPAFLSAVARGVRPLSNLPVEKAFPIVDTASSPWPYLFVGVVAWGFVKARNRSRRGPPMNPWWPVAICVVVVAALMIFLVVRIGVFESMAVGQPEESLGHILANPMLFLIGTILAAVRFARKSRAEAAKGEGRII